MLSLTSTKSKSKPFCLLKNFGGIRTCFHFLFTTYTSCNDTKVIISGAFFVRLSMCSRLCGTRDCGKYTFLGRSVGENIDFLKAKMYYCAKMIWKSLFNAVGNVFLMCLVIFSAHHLFIMVIIVLTFALLNRGCISYNSVFQYFPLYLWVEVLLPSSGQQRNL